MIKIKAVLFLGLFLSMPSCIFDEDFEYIDGDFEIGYVHFPKYRNIYYKSQGILRHQQVFSYSDKANWILLKTHPLDSLDSPIDDSTYYYVLNKPKYINDPNQQDSEGLLGPFNKPDFSSFTNRKKMGVIDWTVFEGD